VTWVTRARIRLPRLRTIAALALSTALAGSASLVLVASASAEGNPSLGVIVTPSATPSPDSMQPSLLVVPLTDRTEFPTTSPSNNACPAGGGTTTPSVSPTVLGVTFDNPPPTVSPPKKGPLPFTGLPLTQLCLLASALVGAGLLLRRSKRQHHLARH
jgi:hypothetical protein